MPRSPLPLILALAAAPAFALDEGTYPVRSDGAQGEISVTERWLTLSLTGSRSCEALGEGRVLRGAEGDWAAVFETGAEPCVLVGNRKEFFQVGGSCAALGSGGCELRGQIGSGARSSEPVQVITAILRGRLGDLGAAERRAVQALLAERGFYAGGVDRAYGPATEAALIAQLQAMADAGEEVDGNRAPFVRELLAGLAAEGAPLAAEVAPAAPSGAPSRRPDRRTADRRAPRPTQDRHLGSSLSRFLLRQRRMQRDADIPAELKRQPDLGCRLPAFDRADRRARDAGLQGERFLAEVD